jgi:23S rRNA pseudouridine2605 synthase
MKKDNRKDSEARKNKGTEQRSKDGKREFSKTSGKRESIPNRPQETGYGDAKKKSFGKDDFKKKKDFSTEGKFAPKKHDSDKKSRLEKEGDSDDFRNVYKGRGRNQKPIFEKVHKSELENQNRPKKKFKNPFTHEKVEEVPKYNFEKVEKHQGKQSPSDEIRLNKYIANSGVCSRREADNLIEQGFVKVNGETVLEMGYKVKRSDHVTYKGKVLNPEKPIYILLNKPKDFITTTDDPMERKTVMSLIDNACEERVFPVGRLDRNTTGLLLFTNDGELAAKLSHPSNKIKKIYQVTLDKPLTNNDEKVILEGLSLEDGPVTVDDMQVLSKDRTILGLEIHVGRNRIVRRIFAHLGYEVTALDRVMYAGLDKKDLGRGRYRFLQEKEVVRLKYFS